LAEKDFGDKAPWTRKPCYAVMIAGVQARMTGEYFHIPNIYLKEGLAKIEDQICSGIAKKNKYPKKNRGRVKTIPALFIFRTIAG